MGKHDIPGLVESEPTDDKWEKLKKKIKDKSRGSFHPAWRPPTSNEILKWMEELEETR